MINSGTISKVIQIMGPRALYLTLSQFCMSLLLTVIEYGVAALGILFLFTLNLISLSDMPQWIQRWFDPTIFSNNSIVVIMISMGLLRASFQFLSRHTAYNAYQLINVRIRLLQSYELLLKDNHHSIPMSLINWRNIEIIPKTANFIHTKIAFYISSIQVTGLLFGMLYLAWKETLLAIVYLGLSTLLIRVLIRKLVKVSKYIPEEVANMERLLVKVTKNWLFVNILGLKNNEYLSYIQSLHSHHKYNNKSNTIIIFGSVLTPLQGIIAIALILHSSLNYFFTSPIDLVGFFYLFLRFSMGMVSVFDLYAGSKLNYPQFLEATKFFSSLSQEDRQKALDPEKYFKIFRPIEPDVLSDTYQDDKIKQNKSLSKPPSIQLNNITFSWPGMKKILFKNFSLKINAGEQFAIKGPNGSGKSTLLGIILGVYKPQSGKVLIDGMDIQQKNSSLSIGYVSSNAYLINGTVRENLTYGLGREMDDDEIWKIVETVRMDFVLKDKDKGLDYMISEDGSGLSEGQKQSISLGRALLRKPKLLVLDEASANLDIHSERNIARIINDLKGSTTTLIVSHKPGMLKNVTNSIDLQSR